MKRFLILLLATSLICPTRAHASQGREFFMSVIYGTLAGTLVGAATLAFTSSPGDNLNNVARGASYGMYAGILLGLYVTYGLDDSSSSSSPDEPKKVDRQAERYEPPVPPPMPPVPPPEKAPPPYVPPPPPPFPQGLPPPSSDEAPPESRHFIKKQNSFVAFRPYIVPPLTERKEWAFGVNVIDYKF